MIVKTNQLLSGKIIVCFWMMSLLVVGCFGPGGGTESGNPETGTMQTFSSNAELTAYMKHEYAESVLPMAAFGEVVSDTALEYGSGDDYSQTNVQETDVDESDKVKTDGTYLYVSNAQTVSIVKAAPADQMAVVATIAVGGTVDSLYLYNNILAILYRPNGGAGENWGGADVIGNVEIGLPYWVSVNSEAGLMLVDVSDQSHPSFVKDIVTDGLFVSSRLITGKLHLVQQFLPDLPRLYLYHDGTEKDRQMRINANTQVLQSITINELLPGYRTFDQGKNPVASGQLVEAENFYRPGEPSGGSVATITTFDLDDPLSSFRSVGVVADVHTIYASTQSLYLTATRWNGGEASTQTTETVPGYGTDIHKFDITGDTVQSAGSGSVMGMILNQFSLSEYLGILRIATTTGSSWAGDAANHVFCLQADGGELSVIGKLEDLAPGESIYAVRFIGDRGFLVTFVKVDPLFTLDLSDPAQPLKIGELKVPGYSDYIHLLGDNHLLTIGKDTQLENGTAYYQGVQLSIFDISDFANPTLLHKEIIGDRGSHSEALWDHKAFTYWAVKGLLAIPIDLYEHQTIPQHAYTVGAKTFSGLYVYRITTTSGFEKLGGIKTSTTDWKRGVFIDDTVYSTQKNAVYSADWSAIAAGVNTLSFP